jgi:ketosteroid isomerase-like protein
MSNSGKPKSNEQIILEICHDVFDAIRSKDVESLANFLADDFIHRNHDGLESGKATFLSGIGTMPVEIMSISGEHLRVSVYGDSAVLTGVQHAGWRQGDGTEGVSSVAFTDVFVLREAVWQMVLAYSVELGS